MKENLRVKCTVFYLGRNLCFIYNIYNDIILVSDRNLPQNTFQLANFSFKVSKVQTY